MVSMTFDDVNIVVNYKSVRIIDGVVPLRQEQCLPCTYPDYIVNIPLANRANNKMRNKTYSTSH